VDSGGAVEPGRGRSLIEEQDHTGDVVPLSERRGPVTMGLLWLTMVTGFPTVLAGFDWYKAGFTLPQVIQCVVVSCAVLLAYSIPATLLGARSGQTYGLLSRGVFGRWGSFLVSLNLVWISIGWYGLNAIFLAEGLKGLYHWPVPTAILAVALAVAMAVNNLFGFSGIANFARYVAAPVLVVWVGCTFWKAMLSCPAAALAAAPHEPFPQGLTVISSFVIGYSVWGNEADYWRYGKPKTSYSVIPLVVSLIIGQVIFPAAGWMLARLTGITDYGAATALMNNYAFGGCAAVAAIVLAVTYFAVNDSGLYGVINALENIREMPRKKMVVLMTASGAAVSAALSFTSRPFELVATVSCIMLPCATVIMMAEWLLLARIFKLPVSFDRVVRFDEVPRVKLPAVAALLAGYAAGLATSGLVPGTEAWHVGVCSLQAWLASLVVYLPLRWWQQRRHVAESRKLVHRLLDLADGAVPAARGTGPHRP